MAIEEVNLAEDISLRLPVSVMVITEKMVAFMLKDGRKFAIPRKTWELLEEFIAPSAPPPPPPPTKSWWEDLEVEVSATYGDIQSPPAARIREQTAPVKQVAKPAPDRNAPTPKIIRGVCKVVNDHFKNPNRGRPSEDVQEAWDLLLTWPNDVFIDMFDGRKCLIEDEQIRNMIVDQREAAIPPLSSSDRTQTSTPFLHFFRKGIPASSGKSQLAIAKETVTRNAPDDSDIPEYREPPSPVANIDPIVDQMNEQMTLFGQMQRERDLAAALARAEAGAEAPAKKSLFERLA